MELAENSNSDDRGESVARDQYCIEVGWEVCHQMGGIYTVLRSKVPTAIETHGENYLLVGPYYEKTAMVEFEPFEPEGIIASVMEKMNKEQTVIHYGRWLVSGSPRVVLIDFLAVFHRLADYKYFFWKDHHIDGGDEPEINDSIVFGYLVVEFITNFTNLMNEMDLEFPLKGIFHEWMAAVAIPEIRRQKLPVATVFHTHATLVGRYVALGDPHMYHHLHQIDPVAAAIHNGIHPRYLIEKAAAHGAHVFTTLSDITALEAEHFLGRKPDLLLPNGLNIHRFSAIHEFQNLHAVFKKRIHEFVSAHFFPSYSFDLEKTRYIFTSGRYEYTNKGFDLYMESLARLNDRLKHTRSELTVIAFLVTRAATKGISSDVLRRQKMFYDLKHTCADIGDRMKDRLLSSVVNGRIPTTEDLFDEYDTTRLMRLKRAWKTEGLPSICTHDMVHDAEDPILNRLRNLGLINGPDDRVKIVYHPEFLSGTNPILPLDYDQFVRGCHMGVFPSYYEPWGYTPLECVALGIPTITSDLAGFGTYVRDSIDDYEEQGIFVLERKNSDYHTAAEKLTDMLENALTMSHRDRVQLRNRVESLSELFDWKRMSVHYEAALSMASNRWSKEQS